MSLNRDVFREYDVRGIADVDFSGDFSYCLGRAFGTYAINHNRKKIAVSGDVRLSTKRLKEGFIKGLIEVGIDVVDIGILPTPTNYFANFNLDIDGSVQITGSHNPPEFNGIKLSFNKKPFYGQDIQNLLKIIKEKSFTSGNGILEKKNIFQWIR